MRAPSPSTRSHGPQAAPNSIQSSASATFSVPPELIELIAERVARQVADLVDRDAAPDPADARLALSKAEAAERIGVSVDHLERHVLPDLRIVRSGRLRLIPVAELERWLAEGAGRALEGGR